MAKTKKAKGKAAESKAVAAKPAKAKSPKAKPGTAKRAAAKANATAKTGGAAAKALGVSPGAASQERLIPGQYFLRSDPIVANADRKAIEVKVENTGDRPIQVGSHFHFFEVNRALRFDRKRAYGLRLDIPAGTAVRFEPGQAKKVALIPLGGKRQVWGLNGRVNGPLK